MQKLIPLNATAGFAGFESSSVEYIDLNSDLDQLLIDNPAATYFGIVEGESMIGDGIFHGDLLIIDRSEPTVDFDIIVANLNGTFVCKRIDKSQKRLLSSNKLNPPYYLKEGEGVVTRSIRLHRAIKKHT